MTDQLSLTNLERMVIFEQGVEEGKRRLEGELQALQNELEKTTAALALALKRLNRYEVPRG
jgi:hypothetical protein